MIEAARLVFSCAEIGIELVSRGRLDLPDMLDVPVSRCELRETTDAQRRLFAHRAPAGDRDVVAYFIRSTVPPSSGCAAHPVGSPGVLLTRQASLWTLAHEIGHVLGLPHVATEGRLMSDGTSSLNGQIPQITPLESAIIHGSPFMFRLEKPEN